ncbi:MAG: 1-acyl-sn-glycerol-3-phosphate acyltransferase [Anaerolineales bacterium]|nr:1-acyl-sn-glycerol-3-phosphate acyltransferase [Anaerolineales bacterium]
MKQKDLFVRRTLRTIIRLLLKILARVEVNGLEKIPATGGCIIAVNHFSRLDSALVFAFVKRDDLTALVADKYLKVFWIRWLVDRVQGIWLHREESDFRAMRAARNYLKSGGVLGIAPEGTRSQTGKLIPAKNGVAYLADKAQVPVVPVAVYGSEDAMQKIRRFQRPHIFLQIGDPLYLPSVAHQDRSDQLAHNTDEIMCAIAAMLPPSYHGAYASHPRLKALLGNASPGS